MIITKGNSNQNSKSTTATRDYHGTLSIFLFPTGENTGVAVKCGDLENSSNQSSLKINAHPSSYACIKNSPMPLQTCSMPSTLPPTPFLATPTSSY